MQAVYMADSSDYVLSMVRAGEFGTIQFAQADVQKLLKQFFKMLNPRYFEVIDSLSKCF
jgi:hypothetical protein